MTHSDPTLLRVLFAEDDARLAHLTCAYLRQHGVHVTWVSSGPEALQAALQGTFDAAILDIMLPGQDGLSVAQTLRTRVPLPILIVTALGEESDRILGLELGADDYLVKPFSVRELLARIRAVVRRSRGYSAAATSLVVGSLRLEPASLRATLGGTELPLTSDEFTLLRVLVERCGRVLSREQLIDLTCRHAEEVFDRAIDVRIARLRHKLGDDGRRPRLIKTLRGAGYMFVGDHTA